MQIRVNPDFCKGCNLCTNVCPRKVFEKGDTPSERGYIQPRIVNPDRCPNSNRKVRARAVCEMCLLTCPDQAISLVEEVGT